MKRLSISENLTLLHKSMVKEEKIPKRYQNFLDRHRKKNKRKKKMDKKERLTQQSSSKDLMWKP